jgi:hypothetical protein
MAAHPNLGLHVVASLVYSHGDQNRQSSTVTNDGKAIDHPLGMDDIMDPDKISVDMNTAKIEAWKKTREAAL